MPERLKLDLDSNEAAVSAQKDLIQTEHDELARNQKRLDDELLILNDLWNSAPRWRAGTKKWPLIDVERAPPLSRRRHH
jgi:hypothetical protein